MEIVGAGSRSANFSLYAYVSIDTNRRQSDALDEWIVSLSMGNYFIIYIYTRCFYLERCIAGMCSVFIYTLD